MITTLLRHLGTHLLSLLVEDRLSTDAVGTSARGEGGERWLLSYSWFYRGLWSGATLPWGVSLAAFGWLWWTTGLEWPLLAMVPLFAGLFTFSAVSARDGFTQQIQVSSWGVGERRWGVLRTAFPSAELKQVQFVMYLNSYRLVQRQGRPIRFGMQIRGIRRFKQLVATYAPYEAFEAIRARISDLGKP